MSSAGLDAGADGVVPGADGSLFARRPDSADGAASLDLLPTRVPDLVDAAPTLTPDGGAVLGSRRTSLFLLDAATGALERAYVEDGGGGGDLEALVGGERRGAGGGARDPLSFAPPPRPTIAVGRHDYMVRAVDSATGATLWNLTWSRVAHVGGGGGGGARARAPPDASRSPHFPATAAGRALGAAESTDPAAGATTTADAGLWRVAAVADASGRAALRRPGAGGWTLRLPSPAVSAFDGDGASLPLDGGEGWGVGGAGGSVVVAPVDGALVALATAPDGDAGDDAGSPLSLVPADGGPRLGRHTVVAAAAGGAPRFLPLPPPAPPAGADGRKAPSLFAIAVAVAVAAAGGAALARGGSGGAAVAADAAADADAAAAEKEAAATAAAPVVEPEPAVAEPAAAEPGPGPEPEPAPPPAPPLPPGAARVGALTYGPDILGYGSGGTLVFAGALASGAGARRDVAVKRLLRRFAADAAAEARALVAADAHPNIVRCHAVEEDADFCYLALERCAGTLADLVADPSPASALTTTPDAGPHAGLPVPTPLALRLAREAGAGVAALHALGLVHRDLKPANILLTAARVAKVSDMGAARCLPVGGSSLETGGGGGSSGWQAPEALARRAAAAAAPPPPGGAPPAPPPSLGRGADVYAYGLLLYHTLTGGGHPAGETYERDFRILRGDVDPRAALRHLPEACHAVSAALARSPRARPPVAALLAHPLWWSAGERVAFLVALSDRVEPEDRAGSAGGDAAPAPSPLLLALESYAPDALGAGAWTDRVPPALLTGGAAARRRYAPRSLRDLLRCVRNKHAHYRELAPDVQAALGAPPEGYMSFWAARFPRLVLACFAFAVRHLPTDPALAPFLPPEAGLLPLGPVPGAGKPLGGTPRAAPTPRRQPPAPAPAPFPAAGPRAELAPLPRPDVAAAVLAAARAAAAAAVPATPPPPAPVFRPTYPRRPGALPCDFFVKTGHCRFADGCRFDHPPEHSVARTPGGHPLRPGEPRCAHHARTRECKFGPACKFDHSG